MPLMAKANSLLMEWCLDCHRAPEKHIRPKGEGNQNIFVMAEWLPEWGDRAKVVPELMRKYNVRSTPVGDPHHEKTPGPITNCSTCHY
jgi:hypothetical protein